MPNSSVTTQATRREDLALYGGAPVRAHGLPYAHQSIDEDDISAVVEVLRSAYITTGPRVAAFEEAFAERVGARYAVAFSSGTAALHAAAFAAGLGPGDEAVTTPLTFCATANCVLYQGARPVFADVEPVTLTLDPREVEQRLTPRTRALVPVDYAGHPADLDRLMAIAERHGLIVIEDACHALGAMSQGRRVGSLSHMTAFSFHPVKHITTGEGGMVTTDRPTFAKQLRLFRNHGIEGEFRQREANGQWYYEMVALGYNYRLTDIGCALGLSQLKKLDGFLARRRAIADQYHSALHELPGIALPSVLPGAHPAWHLYPIQLALDALIGNKPEIFRALRAENIGVNVHYVPVHRHPYYRQRFGSQEGGYPVAEAAYERLISLPLFPGMTDDDVDDVIGAVRKVLCYYTTNHGGEPGCR